MIWLLMYMKMESSQVVNFAAGGVATPADAALMMQLGAEGVFVGSGIFKSGNPEKESKCDCESGYELYRCEDDRQII